MSIRVLYSFPTRIGVSGIGTTAWHQVNELSRLGVDVTLLCGTCEKPFERVRSVHQLFRVGPLRLPMRMFGARYLQVYDRLAARWLRRNHRAVDVVHCWPSGALQTLMVAKRLGIPTILERPSAHTRYALASTEAECKRLKVRLSPRHFEAPNPRKVAHEEREFDAADVLLCPSEFAASTHVEMGVSRQKVLRHQYGADLAVFTQGEQTRKRHELPGLHIVYVGECAPHKGVHYALQAWMLSGAADDGRFTICGRMLQEYYPVIAPFLNHSSVRYSGAQNNVAEILGTCDALVLASVNEGSALVTYEARACGCVLLVSSATGAVCEHMLNGLVHSAGDVPALAAHMRSLREDPGLLDRLRAASCRDRSSLAWSCCGIQTRAAYESLLRRHRLSGRPELRT